MTLQRLVNDARVAEPFPSLAQALSTVASPQIRNRATLGGNVHLDTRCRYVNQSDFWRGALGGCLKSDRSGAYHGQGAGGRNWMESRGLHLTLQYIRALFVSASAGFWVVEIPTE